MAQKECDSWTGLVKQRCARTLAGIPFDVRTMCRHCWNDLNLNGVSSEYPKLIDCVHLGDALNANEQQKGGCKTCGGKLRSCVLHARCRTEVDRDGIYCCDTCPDHELPEEPETFAGEPVRNLLYHLMPIPGRWQRHASLLRERLHLFNGRKIMAIATQPGPLDDPRLVKQIFPDFEFIEVPNDPARREVATFEPLFSRLENEPGVTLYAHAKGVTRAGTTDRWTDILYETMLDYWPCVRKLLNRHPVVGSFLKVGRGWKAESLSNWHYSGSFFWFRNKDLFARDWKRIDQFWSGIESYPSLHFGLHEAGTLFYRDKVEAMFLHGHEVWPRVEAAYAVWKKRRVNMRTVGRNPKLNLAVGDIHEAPQFRGCRVTVAVESEFHGEERFPLVDGPESRKPLRIELGGGSKAREGFVNVDRSPGANVIFDFEALSAAKLPFEDDSAVELYSSHCLEHVRELVALMREIVRICRVGATVEIRVPHPFSAMAMCHGHVQTIGIEQVEHWTRTAVEYWFGPCSKRLELVSSETIKGGDFDRWRKMLPSASDDDILDLCPGAAHETRWVFKVVPK